MTELYWGVLFLIIAAAVNWALGLYEKIGVEQIAWCWKRFGVGLAKVAILVGSVIGLGIVWQYSGIDLTGAGLSPVTMTTTATMYYAYKAIRHLGAVLHGDGQPEEKA